MKGILSRWFKATVRYSSTNAVKPQGVPNEIEVFINGKSVKIEPGVPVIQACAQGGIEVPRFCYHEKLAIAGNCRMCLVEVEKSPKPVASCAMPVAPGMKIFTDTPMVKKAREGVMEFLLANHPLDCAICDQGGECDLQDQSMGFGSDRGRFNEEIIGKRAVEDKNFGPLVKTVMNRCIHCTRCVRFAVEVAGMSELGTSGRGNDMQIGTYVERTLFSEMSGNIIDLCPVGALTSKPYAFQARPWELKRTESIDVMDAVGSNIRVDSRGAVVMRVLPRLNEDINEEWISDKTRFSCDGLRQQRLTIPLLRNATTGTLDPISWSQALSTIYQRIMLAINNGGNICGFAGGLADVESILMLKELLSAIGGNHPIFMDTKFHLPSLQHGFSNIRSNYIMNVPIADIETADCILLLGTHPRHEAPLVNHRIRKAYLRGATIGWIGPRPIRTDLQELDVIDETDPNITSSPKVNYDVEYLGEGAHALAELAGVSTTNTNTKSGKGTKGKKKSQASEGTEVDPTLAERRTSFYNALCKAQRPIVLLGSALLERSDIREIYGSINQLCTVTHSDSGMALSKTLFQTETGWNGYGVLHREAGRVGALDLGVLPGQPTTLPPNTKVVYLLNAEDVSPELLQNSKEIPFVVYQGHHGDAGANHADLVLPGCAYTEKDATYVNLEGRAQMTKAAVPPPNGAREDWQILYAIAESLGVAFDWMPQDALANILSMRYAISKRLGQIAPHLSQPGTLVPAVMTGKENVKSILGTSTPASNSQPDEFILPIQDFYMTDPISRNSPTMAECSQHYTNGRSYRMDSVQMMEEAQALIDTSS
jgi:NADH dehydrogenase (ubiquinone) Fe-S protein 1